MGPCMSALSAASGMPTITFPGEEVATQIAAQVSKIPDEITKSEESIKAEYVNAKAKGEDYNVMGGKGNKTVLVTLSKDADEETIKKEIEKAANMQVAKGEFAEIAAGEVWKAVEPKVDEQKPASIPDTPVMTGDQMWEKAKEKVQEKVEAQVSEQIQIACDEALKKKSS